MGQRAKPPQRAFNIRSKAEREASVFWYGESKDKIHYAIAVVIEDEEVFDSRIFHVDEFVSQKMLAEAIWLWLSSYGAKQIYSSEEIMESGVCSECKQFNPIARYIWHGERIEREMFEREIHQPGCGAALKKVN